MHLTFITKVFYSCKCSFIREASYAYNIFDCGFYLWSIWKDEGINFEENVTWVNMMSSRVQTPLPPKMTSPHTSLAPQGLIKTFFSTLLHLFPHISCPQGNPNISHITFQLTDMLSLNQSCFWIFFPIKHTY